MPLRRLTSVETGSFGGSARIGDVVGFAVELAEVGAHLRAQPPHHLLACGEHLLVQNVPPVSRDADKRT
jgi:hypothetical protein